MKYYDREKAVNYAHKWWNSYNPAFRHFEVDCTNYTSQCLWAGGVPMTNSHNRNEGWWYKWKSNRADSWSYSWSVAHSFRWYLHSNKIGLRAVEVSSANVLTIGDIILYDFDGDGKWQHSTIVTAINSSGIPLVSAHTVNSKDRNWTYRDSHAWTPKIKYKFYHIPDYFDV